MNMPGFTAEASLAPVTYVYSGILASDNVTGADKIVPMNALYPEWPIPPELWPYLSPEVLRRIIGPYIEFWKAAQAAAAAEGASIVPPWWWTFVIEPLLAVGAGVAIGGAAGYGIEKLITPPMPTPGTLPLTPDGKSLACQTQPRTVRHISWDEDAGQWWGCERSLVKTVQEANKRCSLLSPFICKGTCPSGAPCAATATVDSVVQMPGMGFGWRLCGTDLWYTCDCGC